MGAARKGEVTKSGAVARFPAEARGVAAPPGGDRRGPEGTGGDARLSAGCRAGWPAAREPDASSARRWERSLRRDTMALSRASRGCRNARFLSLPRGTNCPPGARRPAGQRRRLEHFFPGNCRLCSAAVHCAHPTPGRSTVPLARLLAGSSLALRAAGEASQGRGS